MPTQRRFEGETLEAALEQVHTALGDDAVITGANKVRKGGLGGFFARETFEVVVDVDDDRDDDFEIDLPPAAAAPTAEPMSPLSLLELAESVSDEEARTALDSNPLEFDAVLNQVIRSEMQAPAPMPVAAPMPAAAPMSVAAPMPAPMPRSRPLQAERVTRLPESICNPVELVRLGVPDQLAQRASRGLDLTDAIAAALEHLPRPEPLPTSGGTVIAVVGDRTNAMNLASTIAKELHISRQSIVLASESTRNARAVQLCTPQEAYDIRRSWRRRKTPTIVAIECEVGRMGNDWAEHVLDALEPSMTWATVDASRKPEDVSDWSNRLGGIDALALLDLDDTTSPASVLRTGIPVGFLDGELATPDTWAEILTDRIAA